MATSMAFMARAWRSCCCSACRRRFATSISATSSRASTSSPSSCWRSWPRPSSSPAIPLSATAAPSASCAATAAPCVMMNLTTALAWSCYFFGLSHLEPSIVNTLHSGMGPLTVVALAAFGVRLAKTDQIGWGRVLRLRRDRAVARGALAGSCCRAVRAGAPARGVRRCSDSRRFSSAARRSR